MVAAGAVRAQLPDEPSSLDPQARPQHQRPQHPHPRSSSSTSTPQWQQGVAAKELQHVSLRTFFFLLLNQKGAQLICLFITRNTLPRLSEQLSVRLNVREYPQPRSLQQPQQQQPDALPEDAQLPELHFWLSPTSNSHTAEQHTHQWKWRQQDTRASSG